MPKSYAPREFARAAGRHGGNETPVTRCPGSDSNRDALRHCPLKTACLPVPPPGRARNIESFRHEVQAFLAKALHSPFMSLASLHFPIAWWCLRSEEHTSELQSQSNLVCRLLLEKKKIV